VFAVIDSSSKVSMLLARGKTDGASRSGQRSALDILSLHIMPTGPNICPRCFKAVFAAEMVIGPERKSYHKLCLNCTSCKTKLAPGALREHDGEPYCRVCHGRLFSTRDLRSANLPSADSSFSEEVKDSRQVVHGDSEDVVVDATETPPAVTASPLRVGLRRSLGGVGVECPRCGKAVYQAEQVLAVGKKWHRACLRCTSCCKRLDTHSLNDKDGEPYCRACYSKNYGPTGSGYALLGKAGG